MKQTLGIIGCGSVVQTMYVYSVPSWKNISGIYVYDIDQNQAEKAVLLIHARITNLEKLVSQSDIIIITTPPHTHYDLLKICLQPGKTVVCEKPFLLNLPEAQEIIQLAKNKGTQLFVAHMRRVLPAPALAKKILESGILGKVKTIQMFEGMRFSYQTQSGYETNNIWGGVLADTGSHTLDLALYITGLDEQELHIQNAEIQRDKPEPSHEIKATFTLQTATGNIAAGLFLSRKQALANKINIYTESGILEVPVGLNDCVRISKNGQEAFLAHTAYVLQNYHQAMALEYEMMFDTERNTIFCAERFINLAAILETLYAA